MTTQEQINALESEQLALRSQMSASDAHAAKCVKRGISFAETYPEDLAAYNEANARFNANEEALAGLYETLAEEKAAAEAKAAKEMNR